ncbi:(2Fe-2S) ferredoxin domain-containing protein [Brevibacillus sp. B_LB10_24]|uniref:(2Fe-2S) ferredoxin domain-containing protein n=1 Tax=Brevibacillus sp. B_LB10_24 TaxID=3380645 RepID=UPI0038BA66CE
MSTWDLSKTKRHVLICNGGSCMKQGAEEVTQAIRAEISRMQADDVIHTTRTRCNGRCEDACVVIVYPEGIWYKQITPSDAAVLVQQHFIADEPVKHRISHQYEEQGFKRTGQTVQGMLKSAKTK